MCFFFGDDFVGFVVFEGGWIFFVCVGFDDVVGCCFIGFELIFVCFVFLGEGG